ncbi:hypothetical protein [Paraburkholderia terrae]
MMSSRVANRVTMKVQERREREIDDAHPAKTASTARLLATR